MDWPDFSKRLGKANWFELSGSLKNRAGEGLKLQCLTGEGKLGFKV